MDIKRLIEDEKRKLSDTRVKLEREIDTLRKEIEHVESDALGVMNKVKMLAAAQVGRGAGMEAIMGEAYARAKRGEFKSAQDYIDHLRESIDEAYSAISEIKSIEANLDAVVRDTATLEERAKSWLQKADALLR